MEFNNLSTLYHTTLNKATAFGGKLKNKYEDEDQQLWHQYRQGNQDAKWQLLDRFKGVIAQQANKQSNVLPKPVVEAKLKAYTLQAFDTYDPSKGTKLSTHVYNYHQQINRDNYKHQQAVRLPENFAIQFSKYQEAKHKLSESKNREPNTMELAEYLGWSPEMVASAERKYHTEMVEGKQEYDAGITEEDTAGSAIRFAYEEMTQEERFIFEHKTGYLNKQIMPMGAIKDQLKVTPHRFNQLQKSIESKLKRALAVQ